MKWQHWHKASIIIYYLQYSTLFTITSPATAGTCGLRPETYAATEGKKYAATTSNVIRVWEATNRMQIRTINKALGHNVTENATTASDIVADVIKEPLQPHLN